MVLRKRKIDTEEERVKVRENDRYGDKKIDRKWDRKIYLIDISIYWERQ